MIPQAVGGGPAQLREEAREREIERRNKQTAEKERGRERGSGCVISSRFLQPSASV